MAQEDIARQIKEVIAEQLGIAEDDVVSSSSFSADLGADSLDLMELILTVEEVFELEISEADVESLETVGHLVTYVSRRCAC